MILDDKFHVEYRAPYNFVLVEKYTGKNKEGNAIPCKKESYFANLEPLFKNYITSYTHGSTSPEDVVKRVDRAMNVLIAAKESIEALKWRK